jgi:RHS repeat-associated protein
MRGAHPISSPQYLRTEHERRVQSVLFDRTTGYAQRLNGSTNEKFGLARSLSVMPGDKINTEVYAKFVDTNTSNWTTALTTLLTQIAAGTAPVGTVIDGGSYSSSTSAFPFPTQAGQITSGSSESGPKAYLNWMVFDKDYNLILSKSGYDRLSATPKETGQDVAHERLFSPEIVIREPGYVYIYLSNEETTPVEVYFDDFKVDHVKGAIVQMDDYYPFGLTYNSYRRENSMSNDWKFQGQEHVDELNLGWDSFKWRNHMPDIGRFFNVDPLAEKYYYNSVYAFSENKVVAHVELEGLEAVTNVHSTGESPSGDGQRKKEEDNVIYQKIKEFGQWLGSVIESMETNFIDYSNEESTKKTDTKVDQAKQVKSVAKVGKAITSGEVKPYVTIAAGKQSSEGPPSMMPGYGEVTVTPSGVELESGYDYSTSPEPLSFSISFGVVFGNSDAPVDGNVEGTAGISNVGIEVGTTTNFESQKVGVVFSTEPTWVSGSVGVSRQVFGLPLR